MASKAAASGMSRSELEAEVRRLRRLVVESKREAMKQANAATDLNNRLADLLRGSDPQIQHIASAPDMESYLFEKEVNEVFQAISEMGHERISDKAHRTFRKCYQVLSALVARTQQLERDLDTLRNTGFNLVSHDACVAKSKQELEQLEDKLAAARREARRTAETHADCGDRLRSAQQAQRKADSERDAARCEAERVRADAEAQARADAASIAALRREAEAVRSSAAVAHVGASSHVECQRRLREYQARVGTLEQQLSSQRMAASPVSPEQTHVECQRKLDMAQQRANLLQVQLDQSMFRAGCGNSAAAGVAVGVHDVCHEQMQRLMRERDAAQHRAAAAVNSNVYEPVSCARHIGADAGEVRRLQQQVDMLRDQLASAQQTAAQAQQDAAAARASTTTAHAACDASLARAQAEAEAVRSAHARCTATAQEVERLTSELDKCRADVKAAKSRRHHGRSTIDEAAEDAADVLDSVADVLQQDGVLRALAGANLPVRTRDWLLDTLNVRVPGPALVSADDTASDLQLRMMVQRTLSAFEPGNVRPVDYKMEAIDADFTALQERLGQRLTRIYDTGYRTRGDVARGLKEVGREFTVKVHGVFRSYIAGLMETLARELVGMIEQEKDMRRHALHRERRKADRQIQELDAERHRYHKLYKAARAKLEARDKCVECQKAGKGTVNDEPLPGSPMHHREALQYYLFDVEAKKAARLATSSSLLRYATLTKSRLVSLETSLLAACAGRPGDAYGGAIPPAAAAYPPPVTSVRDAVAKLMGVELAFHGNLATQLEATLAAERYATRPASPMYPHYPAGLSPPHQAIGARDAQSSILGELLGA